MTVPDVAAGVMKRIRLLAKVGRHVRCREQTALQIVRPGVIRALDSIDEASICLRTNPRAAMSADVEQRVDRTVAIACDDDAFGAECPREIVARLGALIGAAGANPS